MDTRDDFVRTSLRLPAELHDRLTSATGGKRSLNAEIIARFESTFDRTATEDLLPERIGIGDDFQKAIDARAIEMFQTALDMALERMRDNGTIGPALDKAIQQASKGKGE